MTAKDVQPSIVACGFIILVAISATAKKKAPTLINNPIAPEKNNGLSVKDVSPLIAKFIYFLYDFYKNLIICP